MSRPGSEFLAVAVLAAMLSAPSALAAEMTGIWRGTLENETAEIEIEFSEDGNPVYTYTDNRGQTRSVELVEPGQQIRFVPPGGGVQTIVLAEIDKGPERIYLELSTSFERTRNGYFDQRFGATRVEYVLVPEGLKMTVGVRSTSRFGDRDLTVGGNPEETITAGIFQKVR